MKRNIWFRLLVASCPVLAVVAACSVDSKTDFTFVPDDAFAVYKDSGAFPDGTIAQGGSDAGPSGDCTDGQFQCDSAGVLVGCNNGAWADPSTGTDCTSAALCDAARGVCRDCVPGEFRCTKEKLEQCDLDGSGYVLAATCADTASCKVGTNKQLGYCAVCSDGDIVCDPKVLITSGENGPGSLQPAAEVRTCVADGSGTELTELCGSDAPVCDATSGTCLKCNPDEVFCVDGKLLTCKADGTGVDSAKTKDCGVQALCDAANAKCLVADCAPGEAECDAGTGNLRVCGADHLW
ncbi:MAG TPA: hypothetical protein VGP93_01525, partial [Polyangiaceae bacterium]|nr:hypothetical protein [Polyangiaceae bacterium]